MRDPENSVDCELSPLVNDNTSTRTMDPTVFLAGLIKCLWIKLATLWQSQIDFIHEKHLATASPITIASIHLPVRTLVALQPEVLPIHRTEKYFPPDVDLFLQRWALFQLTNYLNKYEPVLLSSQERQIPLHSPPHMPPGNPAMTQAPNNSADNSPISASDDSSLSSHSSSSHPSQEEASHRKDRTRIPSLTHT
jgi:hypothetical protein